MIKKINNISFSLYLLISAIIFSVLLTLNISPLIYSIFLETKNLDILNKLSKTEIMNDYMRIISYLNSHNKNILTFENFSISSTGSYHFFEVKMIFSSIYLLGISCLLLGFLVFILKKKFNIIISLKSLNLFFYEVITICGFILLSFYLNFSKAFTLFHKILFNNDYWIFNIKTDPIIEVLPESYFLTLGIFALSSVILLALLAKLIYITKKTKL
ncbi:TIGR01906 family membrane protein [Clostridium sp.]|uniref:TIGR01906 family membrane protein n=1 Tax=Clostridium sp. TaxID=1506 RepID=UPI0026082C0F|nr:TIGR01906 family membrane protein [Clostridium sp.]